MVGEVAETIEQKKNKWRDFVWEKWESTRHRGFSGPAEKAACQVVSFLCLAVTERGVQRRAGRACGLNSALGEVVECGLDADFRGEWHLLSKIIQPVSNFRDLKARNRGMAHGSGDDVRSGLRFETNVSRQERQDRPDRPTSPHVPASRGGRGATAGRAGGEEREVEGAWVWGAGTGRTLVVIKTIAAG